MLIARVSDTGYGVYDQVGQPITIDRVSLRSGYMTRLLPDADQVNLDRLKEQARATRPRMGGNMVGMESSAQVKAHRDAIDAVGKASGKIKRKRKRKGSQSDMLSIDE